MHLYVSQLEQLFHLAYPSKRVEKSNTLRRKWLDTIHKILNKLSQPNLFWLCRVVICRGQIFWAWGVNTIWGIVQHQRVKLLLVSGYQQFHSVVALLFLQVGRPLLYLFWVCLGAARGVHLVCRISFLCLVSLVPLSLVRVIIVESEDTSRPSVVIWGVCAWSVGLQITRLRLAWGNIHLAWPVVPRGWLRCVVRSLNLLAE